MAGATERVFAAQPFGGAGARVIVAPFQFTTGGEDNLRVVSFNSAAGVRLALQGLRFDELGKQQAFAFQHTPQTDRSVAVQDFPLGAGALQTLTVFAEAGAPLVGQTFVMVQLIRGLTGATIVLGTLLAGYVTARQPLGWPGSPIASSLEGEPVVRQITGTTPAAGAEISETVPTGARWELLSCLFSLATDATVATRRITMLFRVNALNVAAMLAFNTQTAGLDWVYTWGPAIEGTSSTADARVQSGTPLRMILPAGSQFITSTLNLQAGDQYSSPRFLVREWLEGV